MKVWITCFLVLFSAAEIYQWLKHFSLPLPIYILGGIFLAIASNADKQTGLPFQFRLSDSDMQLEQASKKQSVLEKISAK
jgi:hypothetical protein